MELKKEEDLDNIWNQLVEQEKTNHYEVHKRAYEDQFNQMVTTIKNGVIDESNGIYGGDDDLAWTRGGIIYYRPTISSYYVEVMEFYEPRAVRNLWWDWSMGYIYTVGDFADHILAEVFFSITSASSVIGFARLGFDYYNRIDSELTRRTFERADRDGDGMVVHYYSGPFMDSEPSAVCWAWTAYPSVSPPNSDLYDIIRYYMN
ncbi:MAG: hypothetical protein GX053_07560 [Tissierella sp.]|nr:hypothetical protein [Tissierella sp.]